MLLTNRQPDEVFVEVAVRSADYEEGVLDHMPDQRRITNL